MARPDHDIAGRVRQNVNIHAEAHRFEDTGRLIREQGVRYQGVVIEDDVWIGTHASIMPGVRVGRGAVIGAHALVLNDVAPRDVVVGVPARSKRQRGVR